MRVVLDSALRSWNDILLINFLLGKFQFVFMPQKFFFKSPDRLVLCIYQFLLLVGQILMILLRILHIFRVMVEVDHVLTRHTVGSAHNHLGTVVLPHLHSNVILYLRRLLNGVWAWPSSTFLFLLKLSWWLWLCLFVVKLQLVLFCWNLDARILLLFGCFLKQIGDILIGLGWSIVNITHYIAFGWR